VSAAMSLRTCENLQHSIRDAGFQTNEKGHPLPVGRVAVPDDPLKRLRRFVMQLGPIGKRCACPALSWSPTRPRLAGGESQISTSPFSPTGQQAEVYA
jgi:hypothetical protein